ncbi:MAG TPA: xanthine dehydrogenase family protein molybdopterin-binding subunit [Trebonia sp.]|nr:xanthine dehydrogenase family protein molybdopterin-binding subunit [Trebonia sp.]
MTTATQIAGLVGAGVDRVDGPAKVTGEARYPADFGFEELAYAVLVQSTIAAGRIRRIDTAAAEAAPGVLAVITHRNAPRLARAPGGLGVGPPPPLQHDRIVHHGQHIAMVVALTLEQATAAARLIQIGYEETEPLLDIDDPRAKQVENAAGRDVSRGDVEAGLAAAEVVVAATYTTPTQTNNPLGLFATTAYWDGDLLTVHDSTQGTAFARASLAATFGIGESGVRVLAPFVGGAFGAGLRTWPHVVLAAVAARMVDRPVKLVLTRAQMFTSVGYRPATVQHVRLGATRAGELVAIDHEGIEPTALEDDYAESLTRATAVLYDCPNLAGRTRQRKLNVACPTWMRGPGEAPGVFALECALDELAYELGIDPVELRLRNYADVHPSSGRPWSTKALRACYEQGADRFGWARRSPQPRSMRDGRYLVGYGMASAYYGYVQVPCQARVTLGLDGVAVVRSAATDIGPGTYTVMTQVAADLLGLPLERVRLELGDSAMPRAPLQGGSGLTAALGSAVHAACTELVRSFTELAGSPPAADTYPGMLARHQLTELSADGASARRTDLDAEPGIFAAKFAEVRVDPDLAEVRVTRFVAAVDGGRILNEKTAASQIIGGTAGGIGMALLEQTLSDPGTGRIANATFGDYLVAVNADVPDIDVIFTGEPDPINPVGVKGIGEVAIVGVAPAIANAVFHATGRRLRALPITAEQLL